MLIRMPKDENCTLQVLKEQEFLPQLAKHLSISIPTPIKMGKPSSDYPYPFSIYKWLPGKPLNLYCHPREGGYPADSCPRWNDKSCCGNNAFMAQLAFDLAKFLKELQAIVDIDGPAPGEHNWWNGDHISIYDRGAREQIAQMAGSIDVNRAINLWEKACATSWEKKPVWIHGDLFASNILVSNSHCQECNEETIQENTRSSCSACDDENSYKLSAVIDFGRMAIGDPAYDLVIAWTYLSGKSREIFMREMDMDQDVWLRSRAWVLRKAAFDFGRMTDKQCSEAFLLKRIIKEVI
jgi:aminoglycoside phosphotransferase (APT) family kinase protein